MNKNFFISWLIVFVAWMIGSMLVHGIWLGEAYAGLGALFRPEEGQMQTFPVMLLAHVIMAGAFVWIFARGVDAGSWLAQGLRYGLAVAILAPLPTYLIYYAVQPLPAGLVARQIVGDGLLVILLGLLTAFIYRPQLAR